jgi:hypothetical protein
MHSLHLVVKRESAKRKGVNGATIKRNAKADGTKAPAIMYADHGM